MCKKLIFLTSFVLLLGSVSNAEDIQWTDLGADHLWSTPENWDLGRVPTLDDEVLIDVPAAAAPNGPVIQDGIDAKAKGIWTEAPGEPTLTMTGGTLEVAEWIWWGDGADSFGIWTMSGGTVDVANEFELGWGGGAGTLIMTGGTINARKAKIPTGSAAFGELFLHGGTYNVTGAGELDVKENGLIDITEGTLVLEGDETVKVNDLIAAGLITAYAGDGQFELDFDGRNPGKTTLTSVEPAPPELLVTIPVPDAGFDDHVLSEGGYAYIGEAGYIGAWQSHADNQAWIDRGYWAADGDLPALSGNNKAYGNDGGSEDYIYQILDETFIEGATYTLSAWVGQAWEGYENGWGLYFTGEDYTNNLIEASGDAPVGSWQQVSLVYTATAADAGNRIGIKMQGATYVTFEDVTLSYDAGAEPGVTIPVEEGGDIAAANELANAGDTIEIAAGTYVLTSQIEIKDGVTYRGAGPGLTIIDGNDVTRAFVAWGDRSFNEANENLNDSGPKGWVLEGMTIQNCVADTHDRFSYQSAAFNLKTDFAELDADASGGLNLVEADDGYGQIQQRGPDGANDTEDDYIVDFQYLDKDGSGEISEAELDAQLALGVDETYPTESGDGGAIFIGNQAVGTIQNCDLLNNHTPIQGFGDDGGAINITGLSVVTINDCWFEGNYACSPNSVAEDASDTFENYADGDGGHIKIQGGSASAITPGTTLIANRCVFLNGNAEDDGGAIQSAAVGTVVRLDSCWFEGNTSWDNGNVCQFSNNAQNEVTVTNCVFANNITKTDNSPDRMIETNRNSKFINCTFVGNIQEDQDLIYNNANTQDTNGDGVDDETADVTQVINCIFVNNVVGNGDDVLGSRNNDFSIAAMNCLFFGNTLQNGNAADNTQRPDVETGSVLTDPLLDANYVPGADSEAIDGGVDPATVGVTLTTDYNGNARPQGAAYDIGAYEVGATSPVTEGLVAY